MELSASVHPVSRCSASSSDCSDLRVRLVDLVISDVIMLMVVMLGLARHPHLGLDVLQQVLGRILELGVTIVNSTLCHSCCHLQSNTAQVITK